MTSLKTVRRLLGGVAIAVLALDACGGDDDTADEPSTAEADAAVCAGWDDFRQDLSAGDLDRDELAQRAGDLHDLAGDARFEVRFGTEVLVESFAGEATNDEAFEAMEAACD